MEDLLKAAIRDPFIWDDSDPLHVLFWFDELAQRIHGWSFDPDSIQWLHLASGWMMDFVQRIAEDENVEPSGPEIDDSLLRHVYARLGSPI